MSSRLAKVVVLSILLLGSPWATAGEPIRWYKNLEEARAAAQAVNKPIMIEFWADWCAPCKVMDAEVYSDTTVAEALTEKFVPVRVHFDLERDLVRHYRVEAIPYLLFTNSYGTELLHHRGILDAKNLTALLHALPGDVSDFNRLDEILRKDNTNFNALVEMAGRLGDAGLYQASNEFYGKAIKRGEAKKKTASRQTVLMGMGLNFLELKDVKQARKMLNSVITEFPESEAARKARQLLSN